MIVPQVSLLSYLYVAVRHYGHVDDRVVHLKRPGVHYRFHIEVFILYGRLLKCICLFNGPTKSRMSIDFYRSYKQNMVKTYLIVFYAFRSDVFKSI